MSGIWNDIVTFQYLHPRMAYSYISSEISTMKHTRGGGVLSATRISCDGHRNNANERTSY